MLSVWPLLGRRAAFGADVARRACWTLSSAAAALATASASASAVRLRRRFDEFPWRDGRWTSVPDAPVAMPWPSSLARLSPPESFHLLAGSLEVAEAVARMAVGAVDATSASPLQLPAAKNRDEVPGDIRVAGSGGGGVIKKRRAMMKKHKRKKWLKKYHALRLRGKM